MLNWESPNKSFYPISARAVSEMIDLEITYSRQNKKSLSCLLLNRSGDILHRLISQIAVSRTLNVSESTTAT